MSSLALAALILSASAQRIDDPSRGYSFLLPAEYVELPGFVRPDPAVHTGTLGTWVRGLDSDALIVVSIEGMAGTIGRDPMDVADLGRTGAGALKEKWKSFEVDGFRLIQERGGERILVLAVQVPLLPNAVQVMSSGLVENEVAIHEALRDVLASLDGRSNWLTDEERLAKGLEGALRLGVTLFVLAALSFSACAANGFAVASVMLATMPTRASTARSAAPASSMPAPQVLVVQ